MSNVAVHHVAQKAMEEIKAAFVGCVRRLKSQMPLADNRRVVANLLQFNGQRRYRRIQIAPLVLGASTNYAWNANAIGVTTR